MLQRLSVADSAAAIPCPGVDREHDLIVQTTVGLHNAVLEGRSAAVIGPLLELLARFCAQHFVHEEKIMATWDYARLEAHAAAHEELLRTVLDLRLRSKQVIPTTIDTFRLLRRLSEHTDHHDRAASIEIQKRAAAAGAAQSDAAFA